MYGYGGIENYMEVLKPESKGAVSTTSDMANATQEADDAWSWVQKSSELGVRALS